MATHFHRVFWFLLTMDPALVREREAFLRRAKLIPTIDAPKPSLATSEPHAPRRSATSSLDYRALESRPINQGRFAILSRIVKYMKVNQVIYLLFKQRHLEHDLHPLSVDEILEEAMLQDISHHTMKWLEDEALPNNPKIKAFPEKKFAFKPKYDARNRQELYHLLKRNDVKGIGGVYLDDIAEGISDAEKVVSVCS
ncbi:unnamed protein product [Protopolystoma xenopodis]|uniref:TFIIE beta domain-containing protein n=1 Tax=Protopolystoma xenopodis TaxID=117903 RepID=A0A448X2Q4_9PLAT|nr:unnamed protein product [Protopolystoma xenopodis]